MKTTLNEQQTEAFNIIKNHTEKYNQESLAKIVGNENAEKIIEMINNDDRYILDINKYFWAMATWASDGNVENVRQYADKYEEAWSKMISENNGTN